MDGFWKKCHMPCIRRFAACARFRVDTHQLARETGTSSPKSARKARSKCSQPVNVQSMFMSRSIAAWQKSPSEGPIPSRSGPGQTEPWFPTERVGGFTGSCLLHQGFLQNLHRGSIRPYRVPERSFVRNILFLSSNPHGSIMRNFVGPAVQMRNTRPRKVGTVVGMIMLSATGE